MTDKETFILARWAYSVGQPIMSDAEYTILLNEMKSLYPGWEYVNRSWSSDPCPTELLKSIGRVDLIKKIILTDKTESIDSLNYWTDIKNVFTDQLLSEHRFTLSMKHDGWNVQCSYYNGELISVNTRGRSTDSVDVSGLSAILPNRIPVQGKVKVIGECTVSYPLFSEMQSKFNNVLPRSAVSTALARPDYITRLSFHAFDIIGYVPEDLFMELSSWGFEVPRWIRINNYDELITAVDTLSQEKLDYLYPTDGLVCASAAFKRALRVEAWEEPLYRSYITGYEQDYGPHIISMKVLIKPVHTNKGMQYRLPITNIKRIIENNLQIGAPVCFTVVSGANANIDEQSTRRLQLEYSGRWDEFADKVNLEEVQYDIMAK